MKIVSSAQMRLIESRDINERRYSEDDYILLGALGLQNIVLADQAQKPLILCGDNTNGHYGFMLASLLLKNSQLIPTVIYYGSQENRYYQLCHQLSIHISDNPRDIKNCLSNCDYVVDCLYGGEIEAMLAYPDDYLIDQVNQSGKPVLSCDLPSGLDGNDGTLFGDCIRADKTMTLQLPKIGLYLAPGADYVGQLIVEPVGLSYDAIASVSSNCQLCQERDAAAGLPKGNAGNQVLLVARQNQSATAVLLAKGLLNCGATQLTSLADPSVNDILHHALYEVVTQDIDEANIAHTIEKAAFDQKDLVVYGSGVGGSVADQQILKSLLESEASVLLCDQAVLGLANMKEKLDRPARTVLVVNKAQYQELFGYQPSTFVDDLMHTVGSHANLVIVFVDRHILVADKEGLCVLEKGEDVANRNGFEELLAGIIGGLMSQADTLEAIQAGCYSYCQAIRCWKADHFRYRLRADDLLESVETVLNQLSHQAG